jgi:hypothetical protein
VPAKHLRVLTGTRKTEKAASGRHRHILFGGQSRVLDKGPPEALSGDRITSRSFHIPACGGFLLHERTDDLLQIFTEGVNCVCFDGTDELASQVEMLLNDQSPDFALPLRVTNSYATDTVGTTESALS